jgi:hypothetical protein
MGSATNEDFLRTGQQGLARAKDAALQAADQAKRTAGDVASAVGRKANDATAAVGAGLKSVADQLTANAPHEGYLGDAAKTVARTFQDGGNYLEREKFEGVVEDATDVIRRNPVTALLGGLAVGFLIGRSFRR